jgi:D-alanine-D-alanine ligase
MKHIAIIYNSVPDRYSLTHDIKSEMGILENVNAIHAALFEEYNVSPLAFTGDIIFLMEQLMEIKPDAVFNLFEGTYRISKSEVFIPIALDLLGIAYTGSTAKTLELCVQKAKTKEILLRRSVPTPRFAVFKPSEEISTTIPFPLIVKPEHEDASIGISNNSIVHSQSALKTQVEMIWQTYKQPALVEEFIDGREFNVAILGDSDFEHQIGHPNAPRLLPISEISFETMPEDFARIVTYKAKWEEESVEYKETKPICPAPIDLKLELELKQIALRVFNAVGCRDYARVDFRVSKEGKPFVIDVNPNPDISPDAGLARSAKAAGLEYPALIRKIVSFALSRSAS